MIRIKLYGIDGREKAVYDLRDDEELVIQPKPLFTLERIVVEPTLDVRPEHEYAEFKLTPGQEETLRRAAEHERGL